jgi:hypothetical protein
MEGLPLLPHLLHLGAALHGAPMEGRFYNNWCGNFVSSPGYLVTAQHFTGQRAGALPVVEGDLSVHRVNSNSIGKQIRPVTPGLPCRPSPSTAVAAASCWDWSGQR